MSGRNVRKAKGRSLVNRIALAGLVLLALGGIYALAGTGKPVVLTSATLTGSPGTFPVTSALVGCPALANGDAIAEASSKAGSGTVSWTAANQRSGTQLAVSNSARPGRLDVTTWRKSPVIPAKQAKLPTMAGGTVPTSLAKGGLVVSATGADAQGLDVEQLDSADRPIGRCPAPGADFWFAGPASPKEHIELYLLNVDNIPADVAVSAQTDSGPLIGPADSGIVVGPHQMVVQDLDKPFKQAKAFALHVTTSSGRIVAVLRETTSLAQPGAWLPACAPPATSQVLTGLPSSPGSRVLYLTVPGNAAAQVRIFTMSRHGTYVPTGGGSISLPNELTSAIQLRSLSAIPGSIKIISNVPVVASMVISGGQSGSPGAFITGSEAITEQGVVAANPIGQLGRTELVLSAPGRAASVRITETLPGGTLATPTAQVVRIAAKSATEVPITLPKGTRPGKISLVAIVVTPLPGSGPVYAARLAVSHSGLVRTVLPVISSPTVVVLPDVQESLLTVLGSEG